MPKINLLPKNVAELIAAGEVVERPASVLKELIENSIDAKATVITVEIMRGGISFMRITDNGCGISREDTPLAFLRHATSKIKYDNDLDNIKTLGFRGEALAAVSSVAKIEMYTKTRDEEYGTHYIIEGSEEILNEENGCPDGTTIIIRDIFFNTPARMKFLKKDVSEANSCAAVVDRIALSHPEISFKFIRDGKNTLNTSGDGKLKSAVYSVLGRDFSSSLIDVESETDNIKVCGLTCKPIYCKPTRNSQFVFLNGRLVRSGTVNAAVEQAYKNSAMVGKFPGFVLYISVPFNMVDVNVHPAKTEVRFSNEKMIFDAVYVAIKNAILMGDVRPEIKIKPTFNQFERLTIDEYKQEKINTENIKENNFKLNFSPTLKQNSEPIEIDEKLTLRDSNKPLFVNNYSTIGKNGEKIEPETNFEMDNDKNTYKVNVIEKNIKTETQSTKKIDVDIFKDEEEEQIKLIGEAFSTYIIVEKGNSIFMIDKHAAHERIIFNQLKHQINIEVQQLISPISVTLTKEEYFALTDNLDLIEKGGFEIEDFGNSTVILRAIPSVLKNEDLVSLVSELANNLLSKSSLEIERLDDIYHSVACKAAIKAGYNTPDIEKLKLAERVLSSKEIMYCPHGRPVAFEIKKYELEKQFGRIQ